MEGSIALAATLLPAIERVGHVTIQPSAKSPIGRTVLEVRMGAHAHVRTRACMHALCMRVPACAHACMHARSCACLSACAPAHIAASPPRHAPPSLCDAPHLPRAPQPSIPRYTTGVWTKAYLKQQLLVALAGRAGEELVFGIDELSSLNQVRRGRRARLQAAVCGAARGA